MFLDLDEFWKCHGSVLREYFYFSQIAVWPSLALVSLVLSVLA